MHINNQYYLILKTIDELREAGMADNDPKMLKLRLALRDELEKRNKHNKETKLVPKLTHIKTIQLKSDLSNTETSKAEVKKYVLLGMAIALGGVAWYLIKN